ncbi:MAG: B12-binding domain-containing protein, partial [Candidatus Bathyarchaeota archaeon]|nr:B12-binding domain-containing protein [Candidatus Bathyarchaeota archaeon]
MSSLDELIEAFVELDEGRVLSLVEKLIAEIPPPDILEACRKATVTIGERFEKAEYFLSELVYAGEIFRRIMDIVLP